MSGAAVARQTGIIAPTVRDPARFVAAASATTGRSWCRWARCSACSSSPNRSGLPRGPEPFIELWFGDLNHPDLGRSLLGEHGYENLRSRLKEGENAFFVIRTVRGRILQGLGLRARRHLRPRAGQAGRGLLHLPRSRFVQPLRSGGRRRAALHRVGDLHHPLTSRSRPPTRGSWPSWATASTAPPATAALPCSSPSTGCPASVLEGGRPKVEEPDAPWVRIWKSQALPISLFALLLVAVTVVYACARSSPACPRTRTSGRSMASSTASGPSASSGSALATWPSPPSPRC
jgi:NosR/NirI family nitrous oxide reductase transcriptional regulator